MRVHISSPASARASGSTAPVPVSVPRQHWAQMRCHARMSSVNTACSLSTGPCRQHMQSASTLQWLPARALGSSRRPLRDPRQPCRCVAANICYMVERCMSRQHADHGSTRQNPN
jgi:hypothetical protein